MNHDQSIRNLRNMGDRPSLEYLKLMMNTFLLHRFYSDSPAAVGASRIFGDHSRIQNLHSN